MTNVVVNNLHWAKSYFYNTQSMSLAINAQLVINNIGIGLYIKYNSLTFKLIILRLIYNNNNNNNNVHYWKRGNCNWKRARSTSSAGVNWLVECCPILPSPVAPPLTNHTQPTYVADTDYSETIDGVLVTYLTVVTVQKFWEVTLFLLPKHINALRDKGVTHPKDLAQFNIKEFDMVIRSMKGKAATTRFSSN